MSETAPRDDAVRVLHVVRTLGPGGMERNLVRVAADGVRRGARHSILLLHDMTDTVAVPPEVELLRAVAAPRDPRWPLLVAARLAAARPTVIHVRNFGAWTDTVLARAAVAPWVPLVWSFHGMEKAHLAPLERLRYRALAAASTRMFAVSSAARSFVAAELELAPERLGVIANGVDLDRYAPGPERARTERLVVGAVGRLFPVKRFPLLVRAVHDLVARGHDVELRIAGDGPEEGALRALAGALGLGRRLALLGRVEDVPGFLRTLDLFALSSDREASPNALLEAMSTGLACVSTDVGGAREVLDGGRAGVVVPAGDAAGLAAAMAALLDDEPRRRALGHAARARALARYGQRAMLDAYAALYRAPRAP